jgi:hypothetical protein
MTARSSTLRLSRRCVLDAVAVGDRGAEPGFGRSDAAAAALVGLREGCDCLAHIRQIPGSFGARIVHLTGLGNSKSCSVRAKGDRSPRLVVPER